MNEYKDYFDFKNYNYLYHVTGNNQAEEICEDGLYVRGNNIIGVDNIIYTTTIPLKKEDIENLDELLDNELNALTIRPTDQLVIIGSPKELKNKLVENDTKLYNEEEFVGFIDRTFIMGYFNEYKEFIKNINYEYGTDTFNEDEDYYLK